MRHILKPLSFLPALFMMYIIYSFSADTGTQSHALSFKVSYKTVSIVNKAADLEIPPETLISYAEKINTPIRKLAHMTEYAALAISIAFPFYVYGLRGIWLMIIAGGICVGYAYLDEWHQVYVAGRGPSLRDVCIDGIGAMLGIVLVRIVGWTGRMTIFRPKKKKRKKKKQYT